MNKFFRNYLNAWLVFLTVVFLALIVVSFTMGVEYIFAEIGQANNLNVAGQQSSGYNIAGAAKLVPAP